MFITVSRIGQVLCSLFPLQLVGILCLNWVTHLLNFCGVMVNYFAG